MPPDLTAFAPEYRLRPSRGYLWLLAGVAVVWAGAVVLDFSGGASTFARVFHVLIALVYVAVVVKLLTVPATVILDAAGLRVRPWWRWRSVRWDEIAQIRQDPSGKFPCAVLNNGRRVRLMGMPLEVGDRLQAALQQRTAT